MIIMRMDRYDDEIKTKNDVEKSPLSRTERHQKMYDTAYDNRSLVDLNNSQTQGKRELIYKGEYLNGKRWKGEGKEYNGDILRFSGEYLDGKR